MKVNKFITASINANLIYDDDVIITQDKNGDGINDFLPVFCNCEITDFNFEIKKNRELIFQSKDPEIIWDGILDTKSIDGIFNYTITF